MNREEILTKSKNVGLDEREQSVSLTSFGFGNIIALVLCFIFATINGIRGQSYNEFVTIVFASQSATNFYQYKRLKGNKTLLITGIVSGFVAIVAFILFIIKG